jgi:Uma2 family endonuclease
MALVSLEPSELKRLIRQRRTTGADRFDEVWDGVYVMAPLADNEHQSLGLNTAIALKDALDSVENVQIFAGCNVSDRPAKRWKWNYRCPDVAVSLPSNPAQDRKTHWFGGPDFAAEIISRFDRSREKFGFYRSVGVRELLLVDRYPWGLELYRRDEIDWTLAGRSTLVAPGKGILSNVLNVSFRLVVGRARPQIEITRKKPSRTWLV